MVVGFAMDQPSCNSYVGGRDVGYDPGNMIVAHMEPKKLEVVIESDCEIVMHNGKFHVISKYRRTMQTTTQLCAILLCTSALALTTCACLWGWRNLKR